MCGLFAFRLFQILPDLMNLHICIPSMFWPDSTFSGVYQGLALPALEMLLARGECVRSQPQTTESWLCDRFSVTKQQDWPVAAITLEAEVAAQRKAGTGYWLRADPVHLHMEQNQMVLADSQVISISHEETSQLTTTLNQHSVIEGVDPVLPPPAFLPLHADRWYLYLPSAPVIRTHTLGEVAGKDIRHLLPDGVEGAKWRRYINEIQMLLYEHPVNQAREARGEPSINSVWFWGGGTMPEILSRDEQMWSSDLLSRAMVLASDGRHCALPADAQTWLSVAGSGDHCFLMDGLHGKAQYGDMYGWRKRLELFEKDWFAPLLLALRQGRLDQMVITAVGSDITRSFSVSRAGLWKFWRSPKPLSGY